MFAKSVLLVLVALVLALAVLINAEPSDTICKPILATTRDACEAKLDECREEDRPMKWTGRGCTTNKGVRLQDGGCQCKGYCGYGCKGACVRDSECRWDKDEKKCFNKKTGRCGEPMPDCLITPR